MRRTVPRARTSPGRRTGRRAPAAKRSRAKRSAPRRDVPVRKILLGVGAAGLAAGAAWGAWVVGPVLVAHPALAVREITVRGAESVAPEEVLRLAGVEAGDPWLGLDTKAARFRLHTHPAIHEVRVRRPWIGKVRVDVRECAPRARIVVAGVEYGLCDHLRIVPGSAEVRAVLPSIRIAGDVLDLDEVARGLAYLEHIRDRGVADGEPIELVLDPSGRDRIRLPDRGFAATMDVPIPPREAVRNVAAFLEKLDATGETRGTLRLLSEGTAVWSAQA